MRSNPEGDNFTEKKQLGGSISYRTCRGGPWAIQAQMPSSQGFRQSAFNSQIIWLCPKTEGCSQTRFMLVYYCFSTVPCYFLFSLSPIRPLFFTCGRKSQEERKSRKEAWREWGIGRVREWQWPYRHLSQKERKEEKKKKKKRKKT